MPSEVMQSGFSATFKQNEAEFKHLIAQSRNLLNELVDEEDRANEMVADTDAPEPGATPGDGDLKAAKNNAAADKIFATIDDKTDAKYINYTEQKEILINSVKQASDMAFGQNHGLMKSTILELTEALEQEQAAYTKKRNTIIRMKKQNNFTEE
jgi:hypothetical protein